MYSWLNNIVRSVMLFLDSVVYNFIPTVYGFIEKLANLPIFTDADIQSIARNIYGVIGFVMTFLLAFNLLQAIVNPENLTDKKKGFGKIISRSIICLLLIVGVPWAFTFSMDLQSVAMKNEIFTKFIFGGQLSNTTAGVGLSQNTLGSFLYCQSDCDQTHKDYLSTVYKSDSVDLSSLSDHLNDTKSDGKTYWYTYTTFLSTISGGIVLGMLILFSFDIALRTIKLAFLEVISPVAIVSFIDPKSSESGMFKKWFDLCLSNYISLFVRLAAIAFMSKVLGMLPNVKLPTGTSEVEGFLLKLFIIFGVLMFVKDAPKMISDLFGMKSGDFGGNPFKKMAGGALIGAGAAVGMKGVGALTGGVAGGVQAFRRKGNILAGAGQGFLAGAKNAPKIKDASKAGFGGIGKGLTSSTVGSWSKGRDYAASRITGNKDEKRGILNTIKGKMAGTATQMHEAATDSRSARLYKALQTQKKKMGKTPDEKRAFKQQYPNFNPYKEAGIYKNAKYSDVLKQIDDAKGTARDIKAVQQQYSNQYALHPEYANDKDFMDNYNDANKRSADAEKNLTYLKGELDKMDKTGQYTKDADTRALVEAYGADQDASNAPKVPERYVAPSTNTPPSQDEVSNIGNITNNESIRSDIQSGSVNPSGIWTPNQGGNAPNEADANKNKENRNKYPY